MGLWIGFAVAVTVLLAFDLLVLNRKAHRIGLREAAWWSVFWVSIGLSFAIVVWIALGSGPAIDYLTGFLVEKSLSVDNLFVFLVIFGYFKVAPEFQHRVLFWGILGAVVLRGIMIFAGVALIERFEWLLYVFGAFLVYTAYKLAFMGDDSQLDPGKNRAVRFAKKHLPMTDQFHGQKFWVRLDGKLLATPMILVLVTVETSDVLFALDSIPAIFGITNEAFILYSSNIFAILGLRALYFLLAEFMDRFHYLDTGLAIVLGFIGLKMLVHHWVEIPTFVALGLVAVILTASVVLSLKFPPHIAVPKDTADSEPTASSKTD